ncbi:MAG TPA: polysaccharide biosynthesis/export family protein [Candidatus Acidoferrales bacterium]|nr:polysaccharide biosynthesis/export family protein [Candidatus Acidoferrales bacterium]
MKLSRSMYFVLRATLLAALFTVAMPAFAQSVRDANSENSPLLQTVVKKTPADQTAREDLVVPANLPVRNDSSIGPDDLLNISVFEAPEMNTTLRVSDNGEISMQLLGQVHAAGLTPRELQSVLQELLRRSYMKDPHVGVFIQELQSHAVSVVGAVKMAGVFQIRGPKTLLEILSMAQGLADDAGDTVSILHGGGQSDFNNVNHPGLKLSAASNTFQAHEMLVANEALAPSAQDRNPKVENINLRRLLESSDPAINVLVRPGDVVTVSRAGIVYVVGEVNKPGGFVLQNNESISILQALALAQGTTHTSAISQTRIIRTDAMTGKREEIPINLGKIFSGKKMDILLEPKDVVFVPNSTAKSMLYRGSAAALQTAAGVAIYKW